MKCPKETCGEIVNGICSFCGLVEDSPEYIAAVNALLDLATEEDVDASLGW